MVLRTFPRIKYTSEHYYFYIWILFVLERRIQWEEAHYINSCAECGEPDPCAFVFCEPYECKGCDYYEYIGCIDGECLCVLVEKNSPRCDSGYGKEDCRNSRDDAGDGG